MARTLAMFSLDHLEVATKGREEFEADFKRAGAIRSLLIQSLAKSASPLRAPRSSCRLLVFVSAAPRLALL